MAEAEEEWSKMGDSPSLYGINPDKKIILAKDFLLKTNIEKLFPKDLVEQAFGFDEPFLEEQNIEEMRLKKKAMEQSNTESMNNSIFVEQAKKSLQAIKREDLSAKDKKTLEDLFFLLDRIGEIKIQEPKLFSKLFDIL
jgi:hypothetical protein